MKRIGIMGGLICNENLGCVALTYSLLKLIQDIAKDCESEFCYTIFEYEYDEKKYSALAKYLNIPIERLKFAPIGFCNVEDWKLVVKKTATNLKMLRAISECDAVIDITQGDSFTDIYGRERFLSLTIIKEIVIKKKIPFILGPQTYGPFENEELKKRAKDVIEKAKVVISRDEKSKEYIQSFSDKKVFVTTDLAFALPYQVGRNKSSEIIKVGINPSGLLCSNKTEGTNLATKLSVDYDLYLEKIIGTLSKDSRYEVHLIPHVGKDAVENFRDTENVICHDEFATPIEAKNCIADMDVFIGSRMHATIGSFSAGVATIPVAYSRKFAGLYEALGYHHVVDLCELNTEEAVCETLNLVEKHKILLDEVQACMTLVNKKTQELKEILQNELK